MNNLSQTPFVFQNKITDTKTWDDLLRLTWPLTCSLCESRPKYNIYNGFREHSFLTHNHEQLYCISCDVTFHSQFIFAAHLYESHFKVDSQAITSKVRTCPKCITFLGSVMAEFLDDPYIYCIASHFCGYHKNS